MMKRVNRELKRRTKVVRVFPNEESLFRLAGSILIDINDEWVTGRKYLTMEKERSSKEAGLNHFTEKLRRYLWKCIAQ